MTPRAPAGKSADIGSSSEAAAGKQEQPPSEFQLNQNKTSTNAKEFGGKQLRLGLKHPHTLSLLPLSCDGCAASWTRGARPGMNPSSPVQDGMEDGTAQKCFPAKVDPQLM